jgi:hypothetical protein
MGPPRRPILLGAIATALAALVLSGCGSTGIDSSRLAGSIRTTFANLYVLQQSEEGLAKLTPASVQPSAQCIKGVVGSQQNGAGNDWVCNITYFASAVGKQVTVAYQVNMQTNGCYAADVEGPASVTTPLGPEEVGEEARTITAGGSPETGPGSHQIINPLWLIDGCFNTT